MYAHLETKASSNEQVLKNSPTCRHITISEEDTQRQLVEASVTAFADALALAVDNSAGTACGAAVDVVVSTPDSSAQCWTTTLVQDDNSFNDAIATACVHPTAIQTCRSKHTPHRASIPPNESCLNAVRPKIFAAVRDNC